MWNGTRRWPDAAKDHDQQGHLAALAAELLATPPSSQANESTNAARPFAGVLAELTTQDVWDHQASDDCGPPWLWKADSSPHAALPPAPQTPPALAAARPQLQRFHTLVETPPAPAHSQPQLQRSYGPVQVAAISRSSRAETLPYEVVSVCESYVEGDETIKYGEDTIKYEGGPSIVAASKRSGLRLAPSPEEEGDATIAYEPQYVAQDLASSSPASLFDNDSDATLPYPMPVLAPFNANVATPEKASPWIVPIKWRRAEASATNSIAKVCQCITPGCTRPTFNGRPGVTCCRTCEFDAGKSHGPDCNLRNKGPTSALQTGVKTRQWSLGDAGGRSRRPSVVRWNDPVNRPARQLTLVEAWNKISEL